MAVEISPFVFADRFNKVTDARQAQANAVQSQNNKLNFAALLDQAHGKRATDAATTLHSRELEKQAAVDAANMARTLKEISGRNTVADTQAAAQRDTTRLGKGLPTARSTPAEINELSRRSNDTSNLTRADAALKRLQAGMGPVLPKNPTIGNVLDPANKVKPVTPLGVQEKAAIKPPSNTITVGGKDRETSSVETQEYENTADASGRMSLKRVTRKKVDEKVRSSEAKNKSTVPAVDERRIQAGYDFALKQAGIQPSPDHKVQVLPIDGIPHLAFYHEGRLIIQRLQ